MYILIYDTLNYLLTFLLKKNYDNRFKLLHIMIYQTKALRVFLTIDNETCDDPKTVADHFNTFFTNVANCQVQVTSFLCVRFSFSKFYSSRKIIIVKAQGVPQ